MSIPTQLSHEEIHHILASLPDYMGIHTVDLTEPNTVIDAHLQWWNDSYEAIRTRPPFVGQSLIETYFEPQNAMEFVNEAWRNGTARQIFELSDATVDRYRPPNTFVRLEITWMRVGDFIVEIGADTSELRELERDLAEERRAYNDASREAFLNMERARIGHDLHDSVIQNLFAISLRLQSQQSEPWAVSAIHEVINEIRDTIFKIEPSSRPPARTRIEKIIESFSSAWTTPIHTVIHIEREFPDDIIDDVECVLREGLSNSARHAKASEVHVNINATNDSVVITISDNGVGPDGRRRRKAGTLSLAHRAETHGGDFSLTKARNGGTVLTWKCPLN